MHARSGGAFGASIGVSARIQCPRRWRGCSMRRNASTMVGGVGGVTWVDSMAFNTRVRSSTDATDAICEIPYRWIGILRGSLRSVCAPGTLASWYFYHYGCGKNALNSREFLLK